MMLIQMAMAGVMVIMPFYLEMVKKIRQIMGPSCSHSQ